MVWLPDRVCLVFLDWPKSLDAEQQRLLTPYYERSQCHEVPLSK